MSVLSSRASLVMVGLGVMGVMGATSLRASAQSLFVVTATGGGNAPVTVGADSLLDLLDDAVNTQNQFAPFQNADANFSLNYGGIANAITVTKNAGNTSATLTFGPTGTTRTFTGANQDDLENQIEDYLKKDGGNDLTQFLNAVNAQSVIAVSDGNPNATTARMAEFTYNKFGFHADTSRGFELSRAGRVSPISPSSPAEEGLPEGGPEDGGEATSPAPADAGGSALRFSFVVSGATFEAGDFDGETASLQSALDWDFSKRVGLSVGTFVAYNSIGVANVFHAGLAVGVPVRLVLPDSDTPITWQVTPSFTIAGSGSEDIGAGGLILGPGITSYAAWHVTERLTLAMANQITLFEGQELAFDEYEIDPGVSQSMAKNGLKASYRLSERWYGYAGASYSVFFDDAAIDNWISPAVGVGYATPAGSGLSIGFQGDFGDDYTSYGLRVGVGVAF